jgi:hypothetical protein
MENKTNQSGSQNRNRNRNRNRSGGQNRNRNTSNQGYNRGRNQRNRNRNRKPKVIELTLAQKVIKAITFGAVDPNKKNKSSGGPKKKQPQSSSQPKQKTETSTPVQKKSRAPKVYEVTNPRLYVGNLDYDAVESDLEELFRGAGNVISAEVVTNSRTQQSKGFAFVEMGSIEEAKRAVEILHDEDFMGRKLLVSGAKSEGPRGGGEGPAEAA